MAVTLQWRAGYIGSTSSVDKDRSNKALWIYVNNEFVK